MAAITARVIQGERWRVLDAALNITRWEEPANPYAGLESQDASAIYEFERPSWIPGAASVLRVVVADGVTSNQTTPRCHNTDGAVFAAQTTVESFGSAIDLASAAERANRRIEKELINELGYERYRQLPLHDRPRTMVAAVDLIVRDDGTWALDLFNAGDCDIQIHNGVEWIQPISEMGYGKEATERSEAYYRANPNAPKQQLIDFDNELFNTPEAFDSTPIGAFPTSEPLKYTSTRYEGSGPLENCSFIVTSDGLRPEEVPGFNYDNTRSRLEEISEPNVRSEGGGYLKDRDDKAVVSVGNRVTLTPAAIKLPLQGRRVIDTGDGFDIREGSSIESLASNGLDVLRSELPEPIASRFDRLNLPPLLSPRIPFDPPDTGNHISRGI